MSGLVVGTYSLINELADDQQGYNVSIDQTYLETFDKTQNLSDSITTSYNDLIALPSYTGTDFFIITLVPEALSLMKDFLTLPFTVGGEFLTGMTDILGIPTWVASTLLALFCIILIFSFVTLILRFTS